MPHFDMPLHELRGYRPPLAVPSDFDRFWALTLDEARSHALDWDRRRLETGLTSVEVYDVRFAGDGGDPVSAWLVLPRGAAGEELPCVVEYIGYGGGRGLAHERLTWGSAGYAHLVMDTRGQGSGPWVGSTPDPGDSGAPAVPGFLTRGIAAKESYYYRRLFVDAARAVDLARELPEVDPARVAVAGVSQGGGIAMAVAGLSSGLLAAMVDVPFLCSFRRATELTDEPPYAELVRYCAAHRDRVAEVFATLAYFDGVHFASRAGAPALFSVALRDQICPPSTVFAAFNHYAAADKEIRVWEYNGHEGGGQHQVREQLEWLGRRAEVHRHPRSPLV